MRRDKPDLPGAGQWQEGLGAPPLETGGWEGSEAGGESLPSPGPRWQLRCGEQSSFPDLAQAGLRFPLPWCRALALDRFLGVLWLKWAGSLSWDHRRGVAPGESQVPDWPWAPVVL